MKVIIVGAGVGGLTLALMLHQRGLHCEVFEAVPALRPLGVGINVLPHAVRELALLDLLPKLDAIAVRTRELTYANRFGQEIWRELRGLDAGLDAPQFSIHRGFLQNALFEAVVKRLGSDAVMLNRRLLNYRQDESGVVAEFATTADDRLQVPGDIMIGCDGIHSSARALLYPNEGDLRWNGVMMWRGAALHAPLADGRSMVVAGGFSHKLVLYPIGPPQADGRQLLNWVVTYRQAEPGSPVPQREDWNRQGAISDLLPHLAAFSGLPIDLEALVRLSPEFYEYPMVDRDPLPRWTHGRITLLGDAAHPMYPVGSNGAGQAILDARALPKTAAVVASNRSGGPEGAIDEVERRAPNGFAKLTDVIDHDELQAIVSGYAKMAGFAPRQHSTHN